MKIRLHKESGLWVTDDGRVIMPPVKYSRFKKFRFTFGSKNNYGYMVVHYRGKLYYVHRLVAEVHVPNPNPDEYKEVDHRDRNPQNNSSSNLRWANRKMQVDNTRTVDDSLEKYGVRYCENSTGYSRAYYAENAELKRAKNLEYGAKQRALGRRYRTCPDGKKRWLTDAEYNELYKEV